VVGAQDRSVSVVSVACDERPAGVEPSADSEVQVWAASLDVGQAAASECAACLSADELARASRFVAPRDRSRFIVGRAFLRHTLAARLGMRPDEIRLRYASRGKPALEGTTGLQFNLAHSAGLAVCALVEGHAEVGVDVERIESMRDADAVARAVFSPAERARYEALPEEARLRAFFEAWTRKEAFLKALGCGLSRPLASFDVAFGPGEVARLVASCVDPQEVDRVTLHGFEVGAEFVGAVATLGASARAQLWEWHWTERAWTGSRCDLRVDA
jgi:4'-phosphopantetheinyl transferase